MDQTGKTLLVVENNTDLRVLLRDILVDARYQVITARNGLQAWETYKQRHDEIAAVITDLEMPQLGGLALEYRLHTEDSSLPMIAISAYADSPQYRGHLDERFAAILSKPLVGMRLLESIQEAIDSGE